MNISKHPILKTQILGNDQQIDKVEGHTYLGNNLHCYPANKTIPWR